MAKVFVVTGATSGIGLAAAQQLCEQGAFVLGVGRSTARCAAAETRIIRAFHKAQVHYLVADLSLLAQVRQLAAQIGEEFAAREFTNLDGLINDAGTFTWHRRETSEGFETQWAVNHLAPFLLTNELLPLLEKSPAARVVTVSSNAHRGTHLRWKDLQLRHGYFGFQMYKQTKLCNVLFTAELRRRLGEGSTIRAFAVDPGLVHTEIGVKGNPAIVRWFWRWHSLKGATPEESAKEIVPLAIDPSMADRPELYWKHGEPLPPDPVSLDPEEGKRLWETSAAMCGL